MAGMRGTDGRALEGIAHLRQSITNILTTPLGSRVMRRDYGSRLFELIDAPLNAETLADIYGATADALDLWEPRFELTEVSAEAVGEGRVTIRLEGNYLPEGEAITLDGIIL